MKKRKLDTTDSNMLELIERLKLTGTIRFQQEFCDAIELPKQNIYKIKTGLQHFTAAHIRRACEEFKVNANWIMGLEKTVFNSRHRTLNKLTTV